MAAIIFGTEDLAALASFYLSNDSHTKPIAFCVDGKFIKESLFDGLPVIPFEEIQTAYPPMDHCFLAPLQDNHLRMEKAKEIKDKGYSLISYVSTKATVFSSVGENCFILEDNTIQPFVTIGNNVIMWSGNHIGHHSTIKDNVFFSSHVVLSGHCVVEQFCWLGVNSTIKDHVTLAEGTFIAMSSMVTKDTTPYTKYMGVPAKEYEKISTTANNGTSAINLL